MEPVFKNEGNKAHVNLTIDSELVEKAKEEGLNLSATLEEFLRNRYVKNRKSKA